MKQQIYPEMTRKERKEAMKQASYRVEYETYQANLPSDELSAEQDAYSRRAIELKKAKDEFGAYKKKKAAEIKSIEEEMAVQLEIINTGKREIEGNLYMFQDLQTNEMNYFDANGMWVRSRKIRPEERQTTMAIGSSDVPVSDEQLEEQEIEDAQAEDVTDGADTLGTVDMPSEYAGMQAEVMQDAPAHTVDDEPGITGTEEERPDDSHPGEAISLEIDSIDSAGNADFKAVQTDKQEEAEAKLAAHKRNKGRLSKKAADALAGALIPQNEDGIASTSAGDITAEQNNGGDVDEFALPTE